MTGIDTNILIHFLVKTQKEHKQAVDWFAENKDPLATTLTNIAEVLRLLTHPRVFPSPLSLKEVIDLVYEFVEKLEVTLLEESESWWLDLKELLKNLPSLKGNEVFDARIALCLRHNGVKELCTLDTNFAKYSFLKIITI